MGHLHSKIAPLVSHYEIRVPYGELLVTCFLDNVLLHPSAGLHVMWCPDLIGREIWDWDGPLSVIEHEPFPLKGCDQASLVCPLAGKERIDPE